MPPLTTKASSRVAALPKAPLAALDDVLEALLRVALEEGGALERPQLGADADRLKVVDHRLGDVGVRGVAVVLAGVEAVGMTRLGQQLLGLGRIVHRSRRLPVIFESFRDDAAGHPGMAERQRLVDGLAVDRQAGRLPHALIMPRRFRVPLIGEVEPEWAPG